MEPNEVLDQYIDMCNNQSGFFQYCLANNSILEWFGRTIRGRHKIYHFFRYDLCQQYEHNFHDPHSCDPIEIRPSHFESKQVINDDRMDIRNISIKPNNIDITPIQFGIISPKLPKLNRGLKFIPDKDDEEELNELGLSTIPDTIIPPPLELNTDEPPIKKSKHSIQDFLEKTNIEEDTKNLNNIYDNVIPRNNIECNDTKYSPLMYLEVNGTLRVLNRIKHRGVHTPTTLNYTETNNKNSNNNLNELIITNSSSSYWDRDTKLKISYRIRLLDKQIEFALIIYEHIIKKPTIKRNLLSEFDETVISHKNELNNKKETITQITKQNNSIPEVKRKKPLKRLLRLF